MSEYAAIDTVIHELGHVLSWQSRCVHGKKWGLAYGKVYRIYEKEFLSKKSKKKPH
jgi:hypothetical protein